MTDDELYDALDGFLAYDMGATDSGIHDEALRARVKAQLRADSETRDRIVQRLLDSVTDPEEERELIEWLRDEMDIDVR